MPAPNCWPSQPPRGVRDRASRIANSPLIVEHLEKQPQPEATMSLFDLRQGESRALTYHLPHRVRAAVRQFCLFHNRKQWENLVLSK